MKKLAVLILVTMVVSVGISRGTVVTLSGTRAGPIVSFTGPGIPVQPVSGGLIRVGTLTGVPGSNTAEIEAVFQEFATGFTAPDGRIGQTFNNSDATEFNGDQIYLWVFAAPVVTTLEGGFGHGLFTVTNPNIPTSGNPWLFPTHTGSGTDSVTISLGALLDPNGVEDRFLSVQQIDATGGGQLILRVPEPTSALLGLTGLLLVLRRRR